MNRPYAFGIRTRPERIKLDERVSISQLAHVLEAGALCLGNGVNGELVIHRLPLGVDRARPATSCDGPPEPPEAA